MRTLLLSLLLCGLVCSWSALPGQNNALHFDGDGDYITRSPIAGWTANTDFTVEAWFTGVPDGQLCNGNFRRLFVLSIPSRFEIGQCGGNLIIFSTDPAIGGPFTIPTPNINILDGNWHCIGVVRSGTLVEIYLDGGLVYSVTSVGTLNSTLFRVGHWHGPSTSGQDWLGHVDEVRLWNIALPSSQLMTCSHCLLTGAEAGLVAYWQFDQGVPGGDNYTVGVNPGNPITQVIDATFLGNNPGTLHPFTATPDPGFDLMGSDGNFVTPGAPIVYPNYNNLIPFILDPIQMVGIVALCNGAATHFSLLDANGNVPPAGGGVSVDWYYSDDLWVTSTQIPSLSGFQFGVPANTATAINCPNATGYVDREFRAVVTVANSNGTCTYTSEPTGLRINCEVLQANVQVVSTPAAPLCEGDQATFNVSVATNLPAPGPTNDVHIDWEFSVDGGNSWTQLGQFYDQSSFSYPPTPLTVGTMNICFKAIVSNFACGSLTGQTCIQVDPNPVCGSIIGWHTPANLTLIATTPWLTYEICPGDDASVGMDPSMPPFQNCNPQWQYSFTPSNPASWVDLGFSNSLQHTNILPTANWGSNTSIFYRIECRPLSATSGCQPCLSDFIEIRLRPQLSIPTITSVPSSQKICKGNFAILTAQTDPLATVVAWYCNGELVHFGPTFFAFDHACYWVETSDGCSTTRSDTLCITMCTAVAKISCPTVNPCIVPNIPITINGLSSYSVNCGPIVQYDWEVEFLPNGPSYFFTGPTITFTPPPAGVIVYLTVTDSNGCMHSVQTSFEPCQP